MTAWSRYGPLMELVNKPLLFQRPFGLFPKTALVILSLEVKTTKSDHLPEMKQEQTKEKTLKSMKKNLKLKPLPQI